MAGTKTDRLFMWAGGKSRMISHYAPLLPGVFAGRPYVEPFAGGAALFGHLSRQGPVRAHLSDINREIVDLYRLVRDDPGLLIERMGERESEWLPLDIPDRKALYYRWREEYWSLEEGPEATALLYFLMKTGFNGIWQTCKASKGRYGTPVGLARQKDAVFDRDVVSSWSARLAGTEIRCGSYDGIGIDAPSFIFCDPPYRDSFADYGSAFDDAAQLRLVEWCRAQHERTGSTVWLCNRDSGDGFFETHAPDAVIRRFPITYTAGRRKRTGDGFAAKKATELLLTWG